MVAIIFATHAEAHETLQAATQTNDTELYQWHHGKILITGMGLEKTEETLLRHIDSIDLLINIGIAGALKTTIQTNVLHPIAQVAIQKNDHSFHELFLQETGLKLITSQSPLRDPIKRDQLSTRFDLVDMEGYAIAKIATKASKPCKLYKLVSDYCTPNMSSEIQKKLPELSKALAHHVSEIINEMIKVRATGTFT